MKIELPEQAIGLILTILQKSDPLGVYHLDITKEVLRQVNEQKAEKVEKKEKDNA